MVGKIYTFFNNFGTYTMSQKVYWHFVWTLYKKLGKWHCVWTLYKKLGNLNDIVYEQKKKKLGK